MSILEVITVTGVILAISFFALKEHFKIKKNKDSKGCTSCSGCVVKDTCKTTDS